MSDVSNYYQFKTLTQATSIVLQGFYKRCQCDRLAYVYVYNNITYIRPLARNFCEL